MCGKISFAQQNTAINIYGNVFDEQLVLINNATVRVYKQPDSQLLTSAVSDSAGSFHFNLKEKCQITVVIDHLSYQTYKLSLEASRDTSLNICLIDQIQKIDAAVVTVKKKLIEFENGNMVVNIDQLAGNKDNMQKILNRLPGVRLSENNGLTLNGNTAKLYINGQEQKTFSNSQIFAIINSLPPESVEQIELIHSPLAEYSVAAGVIINIKTKNKRFDGYNLYLSSSSNLSILDDKLGTSATVSYMFKKNKVMLNTSFVYQSVIRHSITNDSTVYRSPNQIVINNRDRLMRINALMNSTNLQLNVLDGHKLNFNFNAYIDRYNANGKTNTFNRNANNKSHTDFKESGHDDMWSGNVEYRTKDSLPFNIVTSYGILYGGIRTTDDYSNEYTNPDDNFDMVSRYRMTGAQHIYKFDFTKNFAEKYTLKAGLEGDYGELNSEINNVLTGGIDISETKFNGDERIFEAYLSFTYKPSDKFSAYGGLRTAYTNFRIHNISNNENATNHFFNTLPYLSTTYNFSKNYTTTISLTSFINRPNYMYMIPGIQYIDDYNYKSGNPYLIPQKSYRAMWNNVFFEYFNTYVIYTYTNALISSLLIEKGDNVTESTYLNYANRGRIQGTVILPFQLLKAKLNGQVNLTGLHTKYYNINENFLDGTIKNGSFYGQISADIEYKISDRISIYTTGRYESIYKSLKTETKENFYMNLGISLSLLKQKNLIFTLDYEDVFDTYKEKTVSIYNYNLLYRNYRTNFRLLTFTVHFKLSGGNDIEKEARRQVNNTERFTK
jgi:hypothetical protein